MTRKLLISATTAALTTNAVAQYNYSVDGGFFDIFFAAGTITPTAFKGSLFSTDRWDTPPCASTCGPTGEAIPPTEGQYDITSKSFGPSGSGNPYAEAVAHASLHDFEVDNGTFIGVTIDRNGGAQCSIVPGVLMWGFDQMGDPRGASISRMDITKTIIPGLSGAIARYSQIRDSDIEWPDASELSTSGPRVVLLRHVLHSSPSGTNEVAFYRLDECFSETDRTTITTFPSIGWETDLEIIGTQVYTSTIAACFTDDALDRTGDGRFSIDDVLDLQALANSSGYDIQFDIDGNSAIDDWDISTLELLATLAGSGLFGDADKDGDVDCDDLVIATSHTYGLTVLSGTSGYIIELDYDLDGDNDADDKDAAIELFRVMEPANWVFDDTIDSLDLTAYLNAFLNADPAADIYPPGNPDGLINLFDYDLFQNYYSNPSCL